MNIHVKQDFSVPAAAKNQSQNYLQSIVENFKLVTEKHQDLTYEVESQEHPLKIVLKW